MKKTKKKRTPPKYKVGDRLATAGSHQPFVVAAVERRGSEWWYQNDPKQGGGIHAWLSEDVLTPVRVATTTPSRPSPLYTIGQHLSVKHGGAAFVVSAREWRPAMHDRPASWWYENAKGASVWRPEGGLVPQACGLTALGSREPPCDQPVVGSRNGVPVCKKHLDPASGALPETPSAPEPPDSAKDIALVCDELKEMLLKKNAAYGDSALNPLRVFSRTDAVEQIKVRIDDKLSRLARGHALPDESLDDTVNDLMGYLVLLKIAKRRAPKNPWSSAVTAAILAGGLSMVPYFMLSHLADKVKSVPVAQAKENG